MDDKALTNLKKDERRYNVSMGGFVITGLIAIVFLVLGLFQIRSDFINQVEDLKEESRQQFQGFAETVEENRQRGQDYQTCILFVDPNDRTIETKQSCEIQASEGNPFIEDKIE